MFLIVIGLTAKKKKNIRQADKRMDENITYFPTNGQRTEMLNIQEMTEIQF